MFHCLQALLEPVQILSFIMVRGLLSVPSLRWVVAIKSSTKGFGGPDSLVRRGQSDYLIASLRINFYLCFFFLLLLFGLKAHVCFLLVVLVLLLRA